MLCCFQHFSWSSIVKLTMVLLTYFAFQFYRNGLWFIYRFWQGVYKTLGVQYLLSSHFVTDPTFKGKALGTRLTDDQYHNWSQRVHIYSGPHLIHTKLSWKDWITFAIFISCVPFVTVIFCFFLAGIIAHGQLCIAVNSDISFYFVHFCSALWHSQVCFLLF